MEAKFIGTQDIDAICRQIITNVSEVCPVYLPHVLFMYHYGCRIGELFDFRIWFEPETATVCINPQKKNNLRRLPMVHNDTPQWIEKINLLQEEFHINKRNLQRVIEKAHPVRNLKCGQKNIGAHIFRHNYIKKLVAEGKQVTSIDRMLGYTWQTVGSTYATSKIYYNV